MRIRQALASLAVLAVATGTLAACNDGTTATKADTPALQGSPSASDPAAADSPSAYAGDTGSGDHLDRDGLIQAITAGPLKAGSAHLTMTMSGAMSVTAEGDVSYAKSGPEMKLSLIHI